MLRRCFTNLLVNLAAGYLLFFFSERLFWTVFKPGDSIVDLLVTWLAYSVLACVFLNIVKRCRAHTASRIALAGAIFGWLAEGALVGTLYGTEPSAPFPLSIVQTALSWHMLISVVVGFHLLVGAVRNGSLVKTTLISVGVGFFWAMWAPFQWRENPPIITPVLNFGLHAIVTGALLALACALLSGHTWNQYRPGAFGLILSILILAVFYSAQLQALGARPLILLPLLVGGVLALLRWAKSANHDADQNENRDDNHQAQRNVDASRRWKSATLILLTPLTATLVYALQHAMDTRGLSPSWIFHTLAVVGCLLFVTFGISVVCDFQRKLTLLQK